LSVWVILMTKGIRVSQQGIPVTKAADYQKTMDERWPVVEFAFQGIIDGTFSDTMPGVFKNSFGTVYDIPIFHHGLGFVPGYQLFTVGASFINSGSPLGGTVYADDQDVYIQIFPPVTNGPVNFSFKFFLQMYTRNLAETFAAPVDIVVPAQVSGVSEYGLKITKVTGARAMNSKNKTDYSLDTNAKSLAYQAHGVQAAEASGTFAGSLIIPHRLGYPPTYFIAPLAPLATLNSPNSGKTVSRRLFPGYGIAFADSVNIRIRGAQAGLAGNYLYLLLKEPVEFSV
jgi:hypothetical protein